jgi:hypothetical protein
MSLYNNRIPKHLPMTTLTIVRDIEPRIYKDTAGYTKKRKRVECVCRCGRIFPALKAGVVSGKTQSCGCLTIQNLVKRSSKHGLSKTPEYTVWAAMNSVCTRFSHPHYSLYGGSGITVCERWKSSVVNFVDDMGKKPSQDHYLFLVDPKKKIFEPGNAIWSTKEEQRVLVEHIVQLLYRFPFLQH